MQVTFLAVKIAYYTVKGNNMPEDMPFQTAAAEVMQVKGVAVLQRAQKVADIHGRAWVDGKLTIADMAGMV